MSRFLITLAAAVMPVAVCAAEPQYGIILEPSVWSHGAVSVTVRNLSKVPVTVRDITLTAAGARPCAGAAAPLTIGPGEAVVRPISGCHTSAARRRMIPLAEVGRGENVAATTSSAAGPGTADLTRAATVDRLGKSHKLSAGWAAMDQQHPPPTPQGRRANVSSGDLVCEEAYRE